MADVKDGVPAGAIEGYLSDVTGRLRRRLPHGQVEDIVAEARQHLTDRADELTEEGITRAQAEATAVSGFGPAAEWARAVAASAYEDAGTKSARSIAHCRVGLALGGVPLAAVSGLPVAWQIIHLCLVTGTLLAGAGAFRGRRAQPRAIAVLAAVPVVLTFLYFGCTRVATPDGGMVPRQDIAAALDWYTPDLLDARAKLSLVEQGMSVHGAVGRPVPPALRVGNRYVVPASPAFDGTTLWLTPFKRLTPAQAAAFRRANVWSDPTRLVAEQSAPYRTVRTRAEAANAWHNYGPYWLTTERRDVANYTRMVSVLESARRRRAVFDLEAGGWTALRLSVLTALVLLLDGLAAGAGRLAFRWRRPTRPTVA